MIDIYFIRKPNEWSISRDANLPPLYVMCVGYRVEHDFDFDTVEHRKISDQFDDDMNEFCFSIESQLIENGVLNPGSVLEFRSAVEFIDGGEERHLLIQFPSTCSIGDAERAAANAAISVDRRYFNFGVRWIDICSMYSEVVVTTHD